MSHTCVSESGWVVLCVSCAPARTGCMECLRRAALLRPHIRACHFALVLLEVALRHFPCLSIAEAHTCIVCCRVEINGEQKKRRWIPLRNFESTCVKWWIFAFWCVNYWMIARAVGPSRVVWGPGGGPRAWNPISPLWERKMPLFLRIEVLVLRCARERASECALVRVTMIEYSSLSAASLFFARSLSARRCVSPAMISAPPVRSKHLYVAAAVCCFFAVHNDQIYSCEQPRLFFSPRAADRWILRKSAPLDKFAFYCWLLHAALFLLLLRSERADF